MGNTPSSQHGSPKPDRQGNQQSSQQQQAGSSSRHPNLRLPMPARNAGNLSPSNSNPASPSGTRGSSPRRRKSLELPDLNKLSFTPAAPVPTTATHTSHHLAPSTTANQPTRRAGDPPTTSVTPSSPAAAPAPKRWQQVLGGHSPLAQGLGAMSPLSKSAPGTRQPSASRASVPPPVNQPSYFPAPDPETRGREVSPSPQRAAAPIAIPGTSAPTASGATGPSVPSPSLNPNPDEDGTVSVPISWTGAGRVVMLAGNFANNWKGRIPMVRGVTGFSTTLQLRPGQYRLKFIVDDSWRCSKNIPTATDDDGTLVNWIEVDFPKTAEEVKSEWAMDSVPLAEDDEDDLQWTDVIPPSAYLYQYLEEFPLTFETLDQFRAHLAGIPHMSPCPQPPHLPRILEKVILNNDTKSKWDDSHLPGWDHAPPAGLDDNSILAVPNHVVLNHLTASAIKNGTLGVGTTTRYRKKYITTMFFKPTLADLSGADPARPQPPTNQASNNQPPADQPPNTQPPNNHDGPSPNSAPSAAPGQ